MILELSLHLDFFSIIDDRQLEGCFDAMFLKLRPKCYHDLEGLEGALHIGAALRDRRLDQLEF